ncbi:hypothetical protein GCM10009780_24990 [Actinomadura alba]
MDNPLERQLEDTRTRKAMDQALAGLDTDQQPPAPRIASVTPLRSHRPGTD